MTEYDIKTLIGDVDTLLLEVRKLRDEIADLKAELGELKEPPPKPWSRRKRTVIDLSPVEGGS